MSPAALFALLEEIRDASVEALNTIPILAPGLMGSPERAFVSCGVPADDCPEQLAVWAGPVSERQAGPGSDGQRWSGRLSLVQLNVRSTRCYPTDPIPDTTALEQVAAQTAADGWALWNHLYNRWRSGALFTLCQDVQFMALTPITPSGGVCGWLLTVRVQLDGYSEDIS